ncbi:MAG TPA: tyrosine-protein phosphatase [Candidatus Sulfomarinibacteraceae bacterium]|nr:tyrosine-protein phosphatase [Candidatus Sulfomarinibacteraceae bacterium]
MTPEEHPLVRPVAPTPLPTGILNLRDLGGHATRSGGTIRRGLAYRSADLARLRPDAARAALGQLGIRAVYDLRTGPERQIHPEREKLPPGSRYVIADVLRDTQAGSPAAMYRLMNDPKAAEAVFGGGRGVAMFQKRYREFVMLPSARGALRRLFLGLADAGRRPVLFHCTTGKDRTGWAAAALLLLLDVPEDQVRADFMASNDELRGSLDAWLDSFDTDGGDRTWLEPLTQVQPMYLDTALVEVRRTYGSIPGYFTLGLGIDEAGQRRLRDAFVERG